jgi:hypothetical protein
MSQGRSNMLHVIYTSTFGSSWLVLIHVAHSIWVLCVPSKSEFSAGDDRMRFGTRKEANEPPEKKPKTEKAHLKISEF